MQGMPPEAGQERRDAADFRAQGFQSRPRLAEVNIRRVQVYREA